MNEKEFVAAIAERLENQRIAYMIAGSHSSSVFGQPRATNDLDCVIDPTREQLEALVAGFDDNYYADFVSASDALRSRSMFNVILLSEGLKVDFIIRKDRPYSIEEFARRRVASIHGRDVFVASPEDVVLSKLEWNQISPSERQVQDAFNVILVQGDKLDYPYMQTWAKVLGVSEKLEELLQQANIGDEESNPQI